MIKTLKMFPLLIIIFCSGYLIGCGSILSDNDLILRARDEIDHEMFHEALNDLSLIRNQRTSDVVFLKVSANAGLAGFRALQAYDTISSNENISPTFLLFFILSKQYQNDHISYSRRAITEVESFDSRIESRSRIINTIFVFIEIYKISQILLQNSDTEHLGSFSKSWDPCNDKMFPISSLREIIVSLNKATLALNQIAVGLNDPELKIIFNLIKETQKNIKYDTGVLDEYAVQTNDLKNFRSFINKEILKNTNTCD
jgi:hypothetical protein